MQQTTMTQERTAVSDSIRRWALEMGFDAVGIAPVQPSERIEAYARWVDAGMTGEMGYLSREDAVWKRGDPARVVEGARSAIVVAKNYYPGEAVPAADQVGGGDAVRGAAATKIDAAGVPRSGGVGTGDVRTGDAGAEHEVGPGAAGGDAVGSAVVEDGPPRADGSGIFDPGHAIFARYALNFDYHDVLTPRLIELQNRIREELLPLNGRAYFDTGPILERELAQRAGIGWAGRNTMLIRPGAGSYFFIGVILVDVELSYDRPFERDHCGTCTSCVSACPTGALLGRDESGAPVLDARRCISYLTIEQKGPIPRELRPLIGNRIYGCDICQEVCPHNNPKFVQITNEEAFWPREGVQGARLIELMGMDQAEFSRRFRRSPVKRAKRRGLLRNVAVALGNWGSPEAIPVLSASLDNDEPLVRGHAAWALGRIVSSEQCPEPSAARVAEVLLRRFFAEDDDWVRDEISLALSR